ncbi:FAD-binding domain-containing protein [Diaporthe amygdali]|uniref:FAD-binding domain-containing protein n=1 Tax=Phomopsis amygdali TaxID=1214568 RepID=UPI0022FEB3D3|nr:FAD-binding domain-containing protein [Diaporthe amygdali]KAJ0116703.1 FAD-binding domain-containing protein [Diaporthe amygdali]
MASSAIETLKKVFPSEQLAIAGTGEFEKLNSSYLSSLESEIAPAGIVLPKSADDVAKFINTIKQSAVDGSALFAIRGAGQQPLPGCANIQGGITLDLRLLTGVEIQEGFVSVAAGERWGNIYDRVQEQGLGVTGSRSALGGVGGLALSGGLSLFSSREGFICDNVTNFEVVLASGEIVNANAAENADLWRALRGGGNNLGVVTRFDLRTFKQGPFWGGAVLYFPPSFPGQVEALVRELTRPDASPETHLMLSIGYSASYMQLGGYLCLNQVYHTGMAERPDVLDPFVTVSPQVEQLNTMRALTLREAAGEQAQQSADDVRCAYMNTTVKADVATLKAASEAYLAALEPLKQCEGITCSLTLQPYSTSLLEKSASQGGNVLGLDAIEGPLVSILALTWWKNKADDEKIVGTFRKVIETIDQDAASRGTAVPFKYMNYAWDFQDPIGSYGEENKAFLQRVSKTYDPEGFFQKAVPGGFKLF